MPIKERPYCVSYRKKQVQSLHDTRTKHTLFILFASTQSTPRIHKIPTTCTPIIGLAFFHFNPFIDYRKEAKNDAQLQLLAKRS